MFNAMERAKVRQKEEEDESWGEEIMVPKPSNRKIHCAVCKEQFADYLTVSFGGCSMWRERVIGGCVGSRGFGRILWRCVRVGGGMEG